MDTQAVVRGRCTNASSPGMRRLVLALAAVVCLAFMTVPPVNADIYMYQDEEGTIHMTNVPDSKKYKLFIREPKRKPKTSATAGNARNARLYDSVIKEAAALYALEAELVKAVMRAESNFNPNAVSVKGAKGLMQIMPQNYDSLNIRDPFDPRENIMGGVRYLKQLLDRYEGRLSLALSAYNAGPDVVDRCLTVPPINETQQYVRTVMEYYNFYKAKGLST